MPVPTNTNVSTCIAETFAPIRNVAECAFYVYLVVSFRRLGEETVVACGRPENYVPLSLTPKVYDPVINRFMERWTADPRKRSRILIAIDGPRKQVVNASCR